MTLVRMTAVERQRYVDWWVRHSGLTPRQIRQIATAIWTDRLLDEATDEWHPGEPERRFESLPRQHVFWPQHYPGDEGQ
jgi:hypothetical protein